MGDASTKAFTTQLSVLACLAVAIAEAKKVVLQDRLEKLAQALIELPKSVDDALSIDTAARHVAAMLVGARDVLYLARGSMFPIAMEGALTLKELTYIHAEGYAAGEMKNGPIALIDENMPEMLCARAGPL